MSKCQKCGVYANVHLCDKCVPKKSCVKCKLLSSTIDEPTLCPDCEEEGRNKSVHKNVICEICNKEGDTSIDGHANFYCGSCFAKELVEDKQGIFICKCGEPEYAHVNTSTGEKCDDINCKGTHGNARYNMLNLCNKFAPTHILIPINGMVIK